MRSRIDWKYALSLELTDAGFDFSVLSEFRQRLLDHEAGERLLDEMLAQFTAAGLLSSGGIQRTDSTHVIASAGATSIAIRATTQTFLVDIVSSLFEHFRSRQSGPHEAEYIVQSRQPAEKAGIRRVGGGEKYRFAGYRL